MPIFELQGPDGKTYEVDAPDMETATKAFSPAASGEHKSAAFSEGKAAAKQRIAAPDEYVDVPVYGPDGAATGATERVLKPKADPIGMGAMSVFPFGEDIAMLGKGQVPFSDEYAREKQRLGGEMQANKEAYPNPYMVGQAGSLAGQAFGLSALKLPGAAWGSEALPEGTSIATRGAQMLKRAAGAGAGGATVGAVTGLGEGTGMERLKGAGEGALVGGALGALSVPAVEGVIGAGKLVYDKLGRPVADVARGLMDPRALAEANVAKSLERGRQMTAEGPPEFDYMLSKGEPVMIGDVGGEPTKALARSAANISPEARETLIEPITQRFATQTERVAGDIEGLFPRATDYTQTVQGLHDAARIANAPAYKRAYAQGSSGMFNEKLYDLAQAPTMQQMMRNADRRAKDQPGYGSTKEGQIIDPFTWNNKGELVVKDGMKATDANLAYWDVVKRGLDRKIEGLESAGKWSEARDIKGQRSSLISTLEDMVPTYGAARGTARKFFNAEDAYEAGINLGKANNARDVSELFNAWKGFTAPEKELFARGRVADILQRTSAVKDNTSIVNQTFMGTSPVERAKNLMALGPERSSALEARLRAEQIMDRLRPAVSGGSTTARQLAEYGLAGAAGSGVGYTQGDASLGGVAGILMKAGKGRVNADVAKEVAQILTSKDPVLLAKLTQMASKNSGITESLRGLQASVPSGAVGKVFGKGTISASPKDARSLTAGQIGAAATTPNP
jgi:hypothetical protein